MKKINLILFSLVFAQFIMTGCSSEPGAGERTEKDSADMADAQVDSSLYKELTNIYYALPSPVELTHILAEMETSYDGSILIPTELAKKYSTSADKGIGIGLFSADLAFATIHNQNQDVLNYMKTVKQLSDDLGITATIDQKTLEELKDKMGNKDSLLDVVSDMYWQANDYLKENGRAETAALVVAGGWIEGLYITTKMYENNPNDELRSLIAEQKYSIGDVVAFLDKFSSAPGVENALSQYKELQASFDKVEFVEETNETKSTTEGNMTVIGGGGELKMDDAVLNEILNKVSTIRNELAKNN